MFIFTHTQKQTLEAIHVKKKRKKKIMFIWEALGGSAALPKCLPVFLAGESIYGEIHQVKINHNFPLRQSQPASLRSVATQ